MPAVSESRAATQRAAAIRPWLAVLGISLFGCWASRNASNRERVLQRAAFDLSCQEAQLEVVGLDPDPRPQMTWGVRGCGKQATYILMDNRIVQNSEVAGAQPPK